MYYTFSLLKSLNLNLYSDESLPHFVSQDCADSENFVKQVETGGIGSLADMAVDLIKKHLLSNAQRVNPSADVTITLSNPPGQYIIPSSEWIIEIAKIDLDKLLRVDSSSIRGCYVPEHGKIYLNKGLWCIETVIHEALHACSVTSITQDLLRYQPTYEGLTEFLTGYVMSKSFPDCYQNCWRTQLMRKCQLTYEPMTKIWSSFCNFIPLSIVMPIYFYNGVTDWNGMFSKFIQQIHNCGFKNFQNPFTPTGGVPTHLKLYKQSASNFGKDFREIYDSREKFTDFSKIKI